jgi:two-component system osmolarity sensor histidine kinase EnvZ
MIFPNPKSFAGQTLATTLAVLLAVQLITVVFSGLFVFGPQARRVAAITAQSVAAVSDAADLSEPSARAAIIARLDASEFIDVWPGETAPPASDPRPPILERIFMQALADALQDRTELNWRTDERRRLWLHIRIGPELYWISARSPRFLHPESALIASAAATFALSLLTMLALQRRLTRPLEDLTKAVVAYAAGAQARPVPETGPIELAALSRKFNAMTERLEASEKERAVLLAGISHDLRTPLAKLRLAVEMLAKGDDDLSRAANAHVRDIDRILAQFLAFARGFEAESTTRFDLCALLGEISAMYDADGVAFEICTGRVDAVCARPEALRRALINLTENAVKYGKPPFQIGAFAFDDRVEVFVRDSGDGVGEEMLQTLSRPFVRGDSALERTGAGLGLAIAERVAASHDGRLVLANLDPTGFDARLVLARTVLAQD